jgi:hypothetical protein
MPVFLVLGEKRVDEEDVVDLGDGKKERELSCSPVRVDYVH